MTKGTGTRSLVSLIAANWQHLVGISVVVVFGAAWFVARGGAVAIWPLRHDWLLCGDWAQGHLGWLFFHRDGWHFPPGRSELLPYPVGSSIGYTDSVPWMAMLLKTFPVLASGDFQYLGPWMALCFGLQGYWGWKLAALATERWLPRVLGGMLFALSPVVLWRVGHPALCAQWLVLWALHLHLRRCDTANQVRRAEVSAAINAVAAAGVHPYLLGMVLPFHFALAFRLARVDRKLGRFSHGETLRQATFRRRGTLRPRPGTPASSHRSWATAVYCLAPLPR